MNGWEKRVTAAEHGGNAEDGGDGLAVAAAAGRQGRPIRGAGEKRQEEPERSRDKTRGHTFHKGLWSLHPSHTGLVAAADQWRRQRCGSDHSNGGICTHTTLVLALTEALTLTLAFTTLSIATLTPVESI